MKPCNAPSTVGVPPELLVCPQSQRASVRKPHSLEQSSRWGACERGVSPSDWNNPPAKRLVNVRIVPAAGGFWTFSRVLESGFLQPMEDLPRWVSLSINGFQLEYCLKSINGRHFFYFLYMKYAILFLC